MSETSAVPFADRLLAWFDDHGRHDLPWQQDITPYRVWISEIMLQQTRVATVIPYYLRFMDRFPTVDDLAAASLDEVLHLWSGLGYYARARHLHRAARLVRDDHGGRFPDHPVTLQTLPGIGRSTAAAILAIVHGQRQAILDGNVRRVLCRYHAIGEWPGRPAVEKRLWTLAEAATPARRVRDYTQAIMDLGATLCSRSRPDCPRCPLRDGCRAFAEQRPTAYPVPKPQSRRPERTVTVLLLTNDNGEILLERRPPSGIWGGLWSLPEVPATPSDDDTIRDWCAGRLQSDIDIVATLPALSHGFTHFHLTMHPVQARLRAPTGVLQEDGRLWYNGAGASAHGMAAPIQRLIRRFFDIDTQEDSHATHGPMRQTGQGG